MRKIKLMMGVVGLYFLSSVVSHALPNDRKTFAAALAEARKDKKVLGVYFDNPASGACLALKFKMIGTDRFEALTKGDLVYLMIQDRGTGPQGERLIGEEYLQLENYLKITAFPTFVFFTPDGKMIDRIDGFDPGEDGNADKYFAKIEAAIQQGKTAIATKTAAAPAGQGIDLLSAAKEAAALVRAYEGDVVFTFPSGPQLVSHRTIEVTNDPTEINLVCVDYYDDDKLKKYYSKVIMTGSTKENTFSSTAQPCIRTDFPKWLPENIQVVFSPDGKTATLTSTYHNKSGDVTGTGVLKRNP